MHQSSSIIGRKLALLVSVVLVCLAAAPGAHAADRIYWGNLDVAHIGFANLDGSGGGDFDGAPFVTTDGGPVGTAFWAAQDQIFWPEALSFHVIKFAKLDGSTGGQFGSSTDSDRRGIVIDAAANRVYWPRESANQIEVANLSTGEGLGALATSGSAGTATISSPAGVAIDKSAGRIYWANGGDDTHPISWANLDGTGGGDLDTGSAPAAAAKGPSIDTAAGKIYWSNFGDDTHPIAWAKLDGTGGGSLDVSGATVSGAHGTALDATAGKIYWANLNGTTISYANLDGSGGGDLNTTGASVFGANFPSLIEKPVSSEAPSITGTAQQGQTLTCSGHFANDDVGALLYREPSSVAYQWLSDGSPIGGATSSTYELQSDDVSHDLSCEVTASNFAGSTNDESSPETVGVEPSERLIWANFGGGEISSANLTGLGTDINTLATTVGTPSGTAVDTSTGRVYWADNGGNAIKYANVDSTGGGGTLDTTGATVSSPRGLVVDQQTGKIYWANEGTNKISYANLDSSGGGDLVTTGATVSGPSGVAIDAANNRIYWANGADNDHPISYADLGGAGGGDLVTSGATASGARGPAIDAATGKIYWTNFGNDTISFASLSGGNGGQLSTAGGTLNQPHGLAIDHAAGKLYWVNFASTAISFANLDGSGGGNLNTSGATVNGALFPSLLEKPSSTSDPEVTGTLTPGHTLDCSQGGWADDDPGALLYRAPRSYDYQWLEDDTPISGETGSTYSVQSADAFHNIKCEVTASNDGGSASATSSDAHITGPAPANTTLPSISGTPAVGEVLTCNNGSWDGGSITFSYKWFVDGVDTGGTDSTYTVQPGDLDHPVVCRVTATNPAGSTPADSAARTIQATPQNTAPPSISGTPEQESTLTCDKGTWSGGALSYGYEWLRDDVAIGGETSSTYQVQFADVGHTLKCRVTATNEIGSTPATSSGVLAMRQRTARVFWANTNSAHGLSYANLDGSGDGANVNATGVAVTNPGGVSIDSAAGKLYWSEETLGAFINSANLDNSGAASHLDIGAAPIDSGVQGIAVDPVAGRVYWGSGGVISYANLDGSGGDQLTTTGATVNGPTGFAIDRAAGRLYWTNANDDGHPISYANLNGSGGGGNVNTTGATADVAWGLAISGGKVYWANEGNSTISYANLSGGGGGQLPIAVPVASPDGVAIDADAGKIYWANRGNDTISYADLNGSGGGTLDTSGTGIADGSPAFPALLEKPKNTVAPAITGLQSAGHTITCNKGSWPDDLAAQLYRAPESYGYQWLKDNAPISGETASTYSVQPADTGHAFKCRVTATNLAGSTQATSAAATIKIAPHNTAAPSISGTPSAGHSLTCNKGTWSGSATINYAYQWLKDNAPIAGKTASTYAVQPADTGHAIKCRVTASNEGGEDTATTAATQILAAPSNTAAPSISGTPSAGHSLTCNKGTWSGSATINYAYRWLKDGAAISGATHSTYGVQSADTAHTLKCRVTATNGGGSAMATSAGVVIKAPPRNTVAPKITGTPKVGKTLTCAKGTWTGSAPITYTYKWFRSGTAIGGATAATYVAKVADRGKNLTCRVTARNSVGSASKTSPAVKIT